MTDQNDMEREPSIRLHPQIEPRLFSHTLQSIRAVIRALNTAEITIKDDSKFFGMFDASPSHIPTDTVVGQQAQITGIEEGITYELIFRMFNEAVGVIPGKDNPIVDLRVYAMEGDKPTEEAGDDYIGEGKGVLAGLIWLYPDRKIMADFGHGTQPSENEASQAVMDKIVAHFGLEQSELPPAEGSTLVYYDNDRAQRLVSGLIFLAENRSIG